MPQLVRIFVFALQLGGIFAFTTPLFIKNEPSGRGKKGIWLTKIFLY